MSGRDALEDRRLEEVRAEVGPGLAAGEHAGALGDGVLDVGGRRCRAGPGEISEPMSMPQSRRRAERHRLGAGHEPLDEPVVDLVGDEHPLHRDAQLAGVGEGRADRALGGLLEVGVAQHQHRVLAAELERAADQPLGALLRDQLAGGGRAGEADVVGALDDRRCRSREPGPATTCHRSVGKPASSSSSAPSSAESMVWASGLATTALPASSAGSPSQSAIVNG